VSLALSRCSFKPWSCLAVVGLDGAVFDLGSVASFTSPNEYVEYGMSIMVVLVAVATVSFYNSSSRGSKSCSFSQQTKWQNLLSL